MFAVLAAHRQLHPMAFELVSVFKSSSKSRNVISIKMSLMKIIELRAKRSFKKVNLKVHAFARSLRLKKFDVRAYPMV